METFFLDVGTRMGQRGHMTNSNFQRLLDRLAKANEKYFHLLKMAEAEYEIRFGKNPSDINDDSWIDTFHLPGGSKTTVLQVTQWAQESKGLHK